MKSKVQIYDKYGLKFPIKRDISKITEYLFKIEEIKNNSAVSGLDVKTIEFGVIFTDDNEIKELNAKYRNKNTPTDVITFALFADDENKFVINKTADLGEIYISIDTADRQKEGTLKKEVLLLICHGVLHLLGFDHLNDKDYNFVVKTQNLVISEIYEKVSV